MPQPPSARPKPLFWVIAGVIGLVVAGAFALGFAGFEPRLGGGGLFVLDLLIVIMAGATVVLIVVVLVQLFILAVRRIRNRAGR